MKIEEGSTDEKIVAATYKILREDGVEKATTKRIASEAGVNEVTIFRNFKNKKNLISVVKDYYIERFIKILEDIFDFDGDEEINDYLKSNFYKIAAIPEEEFSIMKIAMEEVREIPEKKRLVSRINNTIIKKLEEFFILKKEQGKIREINTRAIAVMCFSITFQSLVLWKTYSEDTELDIEEYSAEFSDILFNGINP